MASTMPGETSEGWQVGRSVLQVNHYMLEQQLRCDVTFTFGDSAGDRLGAHAYVLTSRSPVFEAMLSERWSDKERPQPIKIDDVEQEIFMEFLRYLYCESCSINAQNALDLLYTAQKYMLPRLVEECTNYVDTNLSSENVCTLFQKSSENGTKELRDRCMSFIYENAGKVLESSDFVNLERETLSGIVASDVLLCGEETPVYLACIRWAEEKCLKDGLEVTDDHVRETLGDILYNIRLPTLDTSKLANLLGDREVVTYEEKGRLLIYTCTQKGGERLKFNPRPRAYSVRRVGSCGELCNYSHRDHTTIVSLRMRVDREVFLLGVVVQAGQSQTLPSGTLRLSGPKTEMTHSLPKRKGINSAEVLFPATSLQPHAHYCLQVTWDKNIAQFSQRHHGFVQRQSFNEGDSYKVNSSGVNFFFANTGSSTGSGTTRRYGQIIQLLFDVYDLNETII